jgi:hypothetical protein
MLWEPLSRRLLEQITTFEIRGEGRRGSNRRERVSYVKLWLQEVLILRERENPDFPNRSKGIRHIAGGASGRRFRIVN